MLSYSQYTMTDRLTDNLPCLDSGKLFSSNHVPEVAPSAITAGGVQTILAGVLDQLPLTNVSRIQRCWPLSSPAVADDTAVADAAAAADELSSPLVNTQRTRAVSPVRSTTEPDGGSKSAHPAAVTHPTTMLTRKTCRILSVATFSHNTIDRSLPG